MRESPVTLAVRGVTGAAWPRERVVALEEAMKALPAEHQVEPEIRHHFAGGPRGHGVYAREMRVKAGTLLTGKIHKHPQLNILSAGRVAVLVDGRMQRLEAGAHVVAPAGAKRIIYAFTDAVWTVVHGTNDSDLDRIEAEFIASSEEEYRLFCESAKGALPCPG